jgi:cytidyltransferase-like protein
MTDVRDSARVRVYADMVADLFHSGHVEFLRQVSQFGDHVVVGINSDEVAAAHKRRPIMTMAERGAAVSACRYVDEVIMDAPWVTDQAWIKQHDIDLVVHGDDYTEEQRLLYYRDPIEMGIFRSVGYTPGISTTAIIRLCQNSSEQFATDFDIDDD